MNMSELDDTEMRGKKKRGRPGKQAVVCAALFYSNACLEVTIGSVCFLLHDWFSILPFSESFVFSHHVPLDGAVGQQEAPEVAGRQGRERRPGSRQGQRRRPAQRRRRRPRHSVRGGQAGQERHAGACQGTGDENIVFIPDCFCVWLVPDFLPAPLLFHIRL